jgi:hypothetical protein
MILFSVMTAYAAALEVGAQLSEGFRAKRAEDICAGIHYEVMDRRVAKIQPNPW